MTDHSKILASAFWAYQNRTDMDRESKLEFMDQYLAADIFSNRQIATILDLRRGTVHEHSDKVDRTGGRLDPNSIPDVLAVIASFKRGEKNDFLVLAAIDAGCSTGMLARLTGQPQSNLTRWARHARALRAAQAAL